MEEFERLKQETIDAENKKREEAERKKAAEERARNLRIEANEKLATEAAEKLRAAFEGRTLTDGAGFLIEAGPTITYQREAWVIRFLTASRGMLFSVTCQDGKYKRAEAPEELDSYERLQEYVIRRLAGITPDMISRATRSA